MHPYRMHKIEAVVENLPKYIVHGAHCTCRGGAGALLRQCGVPAAPLLGNDVVLTKQNPLPRVLLLSQSA